MVTWCFDGKTSREFPYYVFKIDVTTSPVLVIRVDLYGLVVRPVMVSVANKRVVSNQLPLIQLAQDTFY